MKNEKIKEMSVAIVGLGVIGAAFAESFKNIGIKTVYGIDIDEMTIRKAEDKGIITKGYLETKEPLEKSDFSRGSLVSTNPLFIIFLPSAFFKVSSSISIP